MLDFAASDRGERLSVARRQRQAIAPAARSSRRSASLKPMAASTSSVCWPGTLGGAIERGRGGREPWRRCRLGHAVALDDRVRAPARAGVGGLAHREHRRHARVGALGPASATPRAAGGRWPRPAPPAAPATGPGRSGHGSADGSSSSTSRSAAKNCGSMAPTASSTPSAQRYTS